MGKKHFKMAIFNSYVKLPEGTRNYVLFPAAVAVFSRLAATCDAGVVTQRAPKGNLEGLLHTWMARI